MVQFYKSDDLVLAEEPYFMNFGHFIVTIEILCTYFFHHAQNYLRSFLDTILHLGFLCEN
jgi:hypothetical protein